jgi:ribokinase
VTGVHESGPIVVAGAHGQSLLLHVEAVPRGGETVLATGFEEPVDGGKATNQAVAAARLGAPVRLVTMLGNDDRGQRWQQILKSYGVDVQYLIEAEGATDVGFVMLPPNGIPAIASGRDLGAALNGDAVLSVKDAFTGASVVVCQFEAPQSCALESFRLARSVGGAVTILNPAPAAPLHPELAVLTDVLVPNEHEAAALCGTVDEPGTMAVQLARRYGCAVIVTAGPLGCFVAEYSDHGYHCPAPRVPATDTTGAGDAFIGGLATRLRLGDELRAAATYAVSVASFSVSHAGTMPSYPTTADLFAP